MTAESWLAANVRCVMADWHEQRCVIRKLSLTAAQLQSTSRPLPPIGELLEMEIALLDALQIDAEVVEHDDDGCFFVRFLNIDPARREALSDAVQTLFSQSTLERNDSGFYSKITPPRDQPAVGRGSRRPTTPTASVGRESYPNIEEAVANYVSASDSNPNGAA